MRLEDIKGADSTPLELPNTAAIISLNDFLDTTGNLSPEERREIVDQALFLMEEIYVHLPLKRAMHAVDPVQQLKLLRRRVDRLDERQFHNEVISVFKGVRDLHTNYVLPNPYRSHTAFLPFMMEEFYDGVENRHYIVSRMLIGFQHPTFVPGVEILHWSGVPIDQAVIENADREAGSNEAARHVRGLDAMTVRPMAMSLPPTEEWVIVGYVDLNGDEQELRLPWQIFRPDGFTGVGGMSDGADITDKVATAMGLDLNLELTNRARKALFVEGSEERRKQGEALYQGGTFSDPKLEALKAEISFFPDTFEFRTIQDGARNIGYLRIRTFSEPGPAEFIAEVVRIVEQLPQDGLIIDVRNNGGGIIMNGERMLQLFSDDEVEAERLHFINNEVTLAIAESDVFNGFAKDWARSIELSVVTGAVYSQGFPIEPPEMTNAIGRRYQGPVVLITDARCYSTTDIFAAGFQDNELGQILGVDHNTGAGGANVFTHDLLRHVLQDTDFPLGPLPGGASVRFAIRRNTRIGANAGVPLEDLGVVPDRIHRLTRNDVLNANEDLIATAIALL